MSETMRVVVVTGKSGAGRSTAGQSLKDLGFFVVDNLPIGMLSTVVQKNLEEQPQTPLAVVVDAPLGADGTTVGSEALDETRKWLEEAGIPLIVLFIDAADEELVSRHEMLRRPHPVAAPTLVESIAREREALEDIRREADAIIDTTGKTALDWNASLETILATFGGSEAADDHEPMRVPEPPPAPREERVAFRSDAPCGPDDLGRRSFAEAMADRLRLIQQQSPSDSFLLHLDGAWGAGKTTAMCYLREELQSQTGDPERPPWVAVWLNAWQAQRLAAPWWSLLKALNRREREGVGGARRLLLGVRILHDQLRVAGPAFWIPPLLVALVAVTLIWWSGLSSIQTAATIIGTLAVLGGVAPAASRIFFIGSARGARRWVQADDNPLEGVIDLFARSIARAGGPVIFLIDDLDRADEDYVREFLDAVQTMVRDAPRLSKATEPRGGPYFVIAADGRWIRIAYQRHYQTFASVGQPGKPLGYLFLDKIFQLTATLPRVTSKLQAAYLRSQLGLEGAVTGEAAPVPRDEDFGMKVATGTDEGYLDMPPIEFEQLQAQIAAAASEEEVRAAVFQAEALGAQEQLEVRGRAARKVAERAVAEATEHVLEPFREHLEPNPRSMKLFVNQYGILRQIRLLEGITPSTDALARWTVFETRWPALADHLLEHPADVDLIGSAGEAPERVPPALRPMLIDRAVVAAVGQGDQRLTEEQVIACSGAPL